MWQHNFRVLAAIFPARLNFVGMERSALHRKIKLFGLAIRGEGEEFAAAAK